VFNRLFIYSIIHLANWAMRIHIQMIKNTTCSICMVHEGMQPTYTWPLKHAPFKNIPFWRRHFSRVKKSHIQTK